MAKPSYLWVEGPLPGVAHIPTRASLGRLAKPLDFPPLARMKLLAVNRLVSAVDNHGTVSHVHAERLV